MSKGIWFTDEFKQDAVAQVVERGYAVSEVTERLGVSNMRACQSGNHACARLPLFGQQSSRAFAIV